jgi:hypothetical protein
VRTCCKLCNRIKNVSTTKEFLDHVERIHNHQKGLADGTLSQV